MNNPVIILLIAAIVILTAQIINLWYQRKDVMERLDDNVEKLKSLSDRIKSQRETIHKLRVEIATIDTTESHALIANHYYISASNVSDIAQAHYSFMKEFGKYPSRLLLNQMLLAPKYRGTDITSNKTFLGKPIVLTPHYVDRFRWE